LESPDPLSETAFTEDHKTVDLPPLILHGDGDQVVRGCPH
jgi:hypothetical protein